MISKQKHLCILQKGIYVLHKVAKPSCSVQIQVHYNTFGMLADAAQWVLYYISDIDNLSICFGNRNGYGIGAWQMLQ